MKINRAQSAAVFNEWNRRYSEDPESFSPNLDSEGKPITDYGENCARYFEEIAADLGFTSATSASSAVNLTGFSKH